MTDSLACALLSLAPGIGLIAGYRRRLWAPVAAGAAALAGGAFMLANVDGAEERARVGTAMFSAAAACAYAWFLVRRDAREEDGRRRALSGLKNRRDQGAAELAKVKERGMDTRKEQQETQALYGIIKGLAESLSWEDTRPKLEAAVDQYLGLPEFALYVADMRAKAPLHVLTAKNLAGSPGASWATLSRCLQEQGKDLSRPQLLDKPERALAIPILDGSELLGFLYARVPPALEAPAVLARAWSFVSDIAFAFRRVKLFQEVERLSKVDGLTGVHRRGAFEERLHEETVRAKTFKTTYALLMLDIDHFKGLNDRYGHPFGDQVLRRVGEILNGSVYETDFVARYGGEEFIVLLPRADPAGVLRKAESIRRAIESEPFMVALEAVRVTASIGISHFPRDAALPEEIVANADAALYQAKSQGRNRVLDCAALRP